MVKGESIPVDGQNILQKPTVWMYKTPVNDGRFSTTQLVQDF